MRKNRLFAAGLAAALLLGVATPVMAKQPNKGKAYAYGKSKPKPSKPAPKPKKNVKAGVSGGGVTAVGEFSIQARPNSKATGHLNFTSTTDKVRCRGFVSFVPPASDAAYPRTQDVTFKNCRVNDQPLPDPAQIVVTVTDTGQGSVTPDHITFTAGTIAVNHDLTDGNVKVR